MRQRSLSGNHVELCAIFDGWNDLEKENRKKDQGKAFDIVLVRQFYRLASDGSSSQP
jgi:hypothetical protein